MFKNLSVADNVKITLALKLKGGGGKLAEQCASKNTARSLYEEEKNNVSMNNFEARVV